MLDSDDPRVLMHNNPSSFIGADNSPKKLTSLNEIISDKRNKFSVLLDKDERELVKKGDEVTKEEMWKLLEQKRFNKLKE